MRAVILGLMFASTAFGAPPEPGRWQVVNGVPDVVRTIMLVDTQTGETWIYCTGPAHESAWCKMPRYNKASTAPEASEAKAEAKAAPPAFDPDAYLRGIGVDPAGGK